MNARTLLLESLDRRCYHYGGTRWQDAGLPGVILPAILESLCTEAWKSKMLSDTSRTNATPGNVANEHRAWSAELTGPRGTQPVRVSGTWDQMGGATVAVEGEPLLHAYDPWGVWKIDVLGKGLDILTTRTSA